MSSIHAEMSIWRKHLQDCRKDDELKAGEE